MILYENGLRPVPLDVLPPHTVVALGVFDGVHRGHCTLLSVARCLAEELDVPLLVLTFSDTAKQATPLLTLAERRARLAMAGADFVAVYPFAELSLLSPADFAEHVLADVYGCVGAVCGADFRFGKDRAGDAETLKQLLAPHPVVSVPAVCTADGVPISATRIRAALAAGDVALAGAMTGGAYTLCGTVLHGRGFGHKLSAPTANLALPEGVQLPACGVYLTRAVADGVSHPAITNIGKNPTVVADGATTCETHLLDCCMDLYGKQLTVVFLARMRAEQTFANAEALAAQIATDVATARTWFAANPMAN